MNRKHLFLGFLGALILLGIFLFSNRKELRTSGPNDLAVTSTPEPKLAEEASPTPTPHLPKSALKLAPKDLRKIVVLEQVMETKNAGDVRIESDLSNLSPEVKSVAEEVYEETTADHYIERGMVVLVVGRQISQKADIDFLKSVLFEKRAKNADANPLADYSVMTAIPLLIVQYRSIQGDENADKFLAAYILETLKAVTHSPNPKAANDAGSALTYLTGKK